LLCKGYSLSVRFRSVTPDRPKRYSFCKENDQFYVFHSDNTFDEKGYPTYHGYPINEKEVPPIIKSKLNVR